MVRVRGDVDASHFIDTEDDIDLNGPGGVYESQPILRTDVVKEQDR